MTKQITFVTSNQEKLRTARYAAEDYDIEIIHAELSVDEIQHQDPLKIIKHKTKSAYVILKKPIVMNDSFWSIPALGGFPGGYMKDVYNWFSSEDFLALMKNKADKSIVLTDVNSYYDGKQYKDFSVTRYGKFIDKPRGKSGPSFAKVVVMDDEGITISEVFDQPTRTGDANRYTQWRDFLDWYTNN